MSTSETFQEDLNPHHIARQQFDLAVPFVRELKGWRGIAQWLFEPDRAVTVNIPVEMDDGYVHLFRGFRVLHNDTRGPGKGGIRFHPNVDEDEVTALATWMSWKSTLGPRVASGLTKRGRRWLMSLSKWQPNTAKDRLLMAISSLVKVCLMLSAFMAMKPGLSV